MKILPSGERSRNIVVCLLCGILLGLSFPPFKTWFLVYPGMVILLHLILTSAKFKQIFARGYFSILFFNAVTLYWISGWEGDDFFLKIGGIATVLVHPLFFMLPILLTYFIYRVFNKGIALIFFPLFWTGFEYSHNLGQLAFPWIELGNTETYNLNRIQYIDYFGVHGTTFLICVISVLLYYLIIKLRNREWRISSSPSLVFIFSILVFLIGPNIYSYFYLLNNKDSRTYFSFQDTTRVVRSAIIQTNVDPFNKWTGNPDQIVDSYMKQLDSAVSFDPYLIVVHETAVPYYFFESTYFYNSLKFIDFVNVNRKYLLMGIPYLQYYPDSLQAPRDSKISSITHRKYKTFNSAILIEPDKNYKDFQIHEKAKLVPFSENVPYSNVLPFLVSWIKWGVGISSWNAGDSLVVFKLIDQAKKKDLKFEALVCFESVFSDYVSEGVKKGAEFLIIITNDGWFGKSSGPVQHQQFAVLRAIENRKWIIRAAQTGISCFIDPLGRAYDKLPVYTKGITTKDIIANDEKTFYSLRGDIIGSVGYYVGIISFLLGLIYFFYKKRIRKN